MRDPLQRQSLGIRHGEVSLARFELPRHDLTSPNGGNLQVDQFRRWERLATKAGASGVAVRIVVRVCGGPRCWRQRQSRSSPRISVAVSNAISQSNEDSAAARPPIPLSKSQAARKTDGLPDLRHHPDTPRGMVRARQGPYQHGPCATKGIP